MLKLAGAEPVFRYRAREQQSIAYRHTEQWDLEIDALREAIEGANAALGPHAPDTVQLHARLADVLTGLRRYAEALPHRELLLAVAEAREGRESTAYADALAGYALILDQTGRYSEAQREYRRALNLRRRLLGERHPSVVVLRLNLAELERIRGELESAERAFGDLEAALAADPAADPDLLARTLIGYGLTLLGTHEYDAAAEKLERARALREATVGAASPLYGRVLLAQGQLEIARREYSAGTGFLEQALKVLRGAPGWSDTAEQAEIELAIARVRVERSAAAMDAAEDLIERAAERRGPLQPASALEWRNLAVSLTEIGEFERARKALEKAEGASRFELIEALRAELSSRASGTVAQLQEFSTCIYRC